MGLRRFSLVLALCGFLVSQQARSGEPDAVVRLSATDREVLCQALFESFVQDPATQSRVTELLQARQPAFIAPVFKREERNQISFESVTPPTAWMKPSQIPSELARLLLDQNVLPTEQNGLAHKVPVTAIAARIPEASIRLTPKVSALRCVPSTDGSTLRLELEFEQIEATVPVQIGVTYEDPKKKGEQVFQELLIGAPVDGNPQPISGIRAQVRIKNPTIALSLAIPEKGTLVRAEDLQVLSTPSEFSALVSAPEDLKLAVGLPGGGSVGAKFSAELRAGIESATGEQAAQRIGEEFQRAEFIAPMRAAALAEINPLIAKARESLSREVAVEQIPLRLSLRKAIGELGEASKDFSPRIGRRDSAQIASFEERQSTRLMTHDTIARLLGEISKVDSFEKYKAEAVQDQLRLAIELAGQYLRDPALARNLIDPKRPEKGDRARRRVQELLRKYAPDRAFKPQESDMREDLDAIRSILKDLKTAIPLDGVLNKEHPIASDFSEVSARLQRLTRIHQRVAMSRSFQFSINEESTRLRNLQVGIDVLTRDLKGDQFMLPGRGCNTTEPQSPVRVSSAGVSLERVNALLGALYEDGTISELARPHDLDLTIPLQLRGTHQSHRFEMDIGVKKASVVPVFSDFDFKGKIALEMNPLADGSGVQIEVMGLKDLKREFDPRMILNPLDGLLSLLLGPLVESIAESKFDEASGKMTFTLRSEELKRRGLKISRVYLDASDPKKPELKVDYALTEQSQGGRP
jgi:hypothetical protein